MRAPNQRSQYGGPENWLQVLSRKSRLRSATKPRPPPPLETLGRSEPDPIVIVDSDDDATPPEPPSDAAAADAGDDDANADDANADDDDADADSDYRGFCDQLKGDAAADPVEIDDNAGDQRADEDVDDGDTDSCYMLFLNQLTGDANSRVVETVEANSVSVFDGPGDVRPSKRPVGVFDNAGIERPPKRRSARIERRRSAGIERPPMCRSAGIEWPPKRRSAGIERPPKRRREGGDCDDVDDDAYCLFLSHLVMDGKSYALEMGNGEGRFKYEEEEEAENFTADDEPDEPHSDVEPDSDVECNAEDDGDYLPDSDVECVAENDGDYLPDSDVECAAEDDGEEDGDYLTFLNNVREDDGTMILRYGSVFRYGEEEEANSETEQGIEEDEDYMKFLKLARRLDNGSMILELRKNVIIRFGEEEKSEKKGRQNDSEKERGFMEEPMATAQEIHIKTEYIEEGSYLYSGETALQPYNFSIDKDDGCSVVTMRNCSQAVFIEKLNDVLCKPFDQNEYDKLKGLAARRSPKEKMKVLRSESKSYRTNKLGLSYLDHYPKLAKMIQSADCHDGLILLRGLFYHLQNVAHDGAFLPWEFASSGYKPLPPCVGTLPIEISDD